MDKYRGIEGGGGKYGSELGVRPGELVDGTRMTGEGCVGGVGVTGDIVDFDGTVCFWYSWVFIFILLANIS